MPKTICAKLNITPQKSVIHIVQFERTRVEVLGEINSVSIRLSSNPKVCEIIDILVADIPKFYGLILSRDWSEKYMDILLHIGLTCGFLTMGSQIKFKLTEKNT
jgi:hypothetical protein